MKVLFCSLVVVAASVPASAQHAGDVLIGSTAAGAGTLTADFDFGNTPDVHVSQFFDFGNGTSLFTATEPGFDAAADEPAEGVFALVPGTQIGLRLLSAGPGVAVQVNGLLLDDPGETAVLGTFAGGEELHVHPTFRLLAATNDAGLHGMSFQLFQGNGSRYAASAPYAMTLSTVVPEPASLATLGLVAAGLVRRRRR